MKNLLSKLTSDNAARWIAGSLAFVGVTLEITQSLVEIPGLGSVSHIGTTLIGVAIVTKQVLLVLQKHFPPRP